jgi:hypothetical protein
MDYVTIYLDHALIGCGFRRALVASIGPKWVWLFYPAGLQSVQLPRGTYDNSKALPVVEYDKKLLASLVSRQVKSAEADGRFDGGTTARDCLKFLLL